MPGRVRTAIIGGGMAGCAAARELVKAGREVVLFEAADGLGGRARSWHRPEIEPDVGINLMYVSFYRLMSEQIREYGLEDQLMKISSTVYISDHGKPVGLSSDSPASLLSYRHVPLRDRIAFLINTLREVSRRKHFDLFDPLRSAPHDDGTTATAYGHSRMSKRAFDYLLRPQIEGFWNFACEDIASVHARALLAWMGGSNFYVLRNGMETLAERNAEGADLRLSHEVTDIRSEDGKIHITASDADGQPVTEIVDDLVVATPAPIAAKLTASLGPDIVNGQTRKFLETQEYEPALSVTYLVDAGSLPSEAHIVAGGPEDPPLRNMITYPRQVRDEHGRPKDKLLVFAYPGRANTRRLLGRPTEEQFAAVTPLLKTLWPDFPADPEPFHIAERPYGFPIPAPGRYRMSAELTRRQAPPVTFAGDYFNSPTTEAAMLSGVRAAASLRGVSPS
ncbi:FAD-dependent oxidoreductase [Kibdelosporangium aridum]|uniref:FAD-dependent oxidoreductase n=1 Tax=Kibdelosporangium aridum TaxID=2030 RepID=UPI0005275227